MIQGGNVYGLRCGWVGMVVREKRVRSMGRPVTSNLAVFDSYEVTGPDRWSENGVSKLWASKPQITDFFGVC